MNAKEGDGEPSNSSSNSSGVASPCLCHSSPRSVYCTTCVDHALKEARLQYQTARQQWKDARQQAEQYFRHTHDPTLQIAELQAESEHLRETLEDLRKQCADVTVATCQQQLQLAPPQPSHALDVHSQLSTLEDATCGALRHAIYHSQTRVRTLRWHYCLRLFELYRLQVEQPKSRNTILSGIGKIAGLPLPHAGPELYGCLPQPELTSALRLVASLVHYCARCLALPLPHPILLQPVFDNMNHTGDIIETTASSPTNHLEPREPLSMEPSKVKQRVKHSFAAVLQEQPHGGSQYSLDNDKNEIALSLLQNDIMGLCIRAGVSIADLWPGEAILLNLHALSRQAKAHVGVS